MEKKKMILSIVAAASLVGIFLPGYSELQDLRQENEQLGSRIALLEEHNDELKQDLRRMRQDPEYVERKAREKLGIVKKGEVIYKSPR